MNRSFHTEAPLRHELILTLALLATTVGADTAAAHSLQELEHELGEKERYFQPIDRPTPELALRDAEGRNVGLADLRGQVVVLHFVYASCTDICPLHAEKLAEVQAMVNHTPMKERVRFVTITTDPVRDTSSIMRDYGPAHCRLKTCCHARTLSLCPGRS